MKKLFTIIIAATVSMQTIAQVVVKRDITQNIESPFKSHLEVSMNKASGNYPEKRISIEIKLEVDKNLGNLVKFISNMDIEKVELYCYKDGKAELSTTNYNPKTIDGFFVMDSPLYGGSQKYQLNFYVKGSPARIWITEVKRVKPSIKNVPKQIPQ